MSKGMGTGVATGTTTGTMAGRAETATGRVPLWQPARMKPVARIARHFNRIRESFLVSPNQKPREKRIANTFSSMAIFAGRSTVNRSKNYIGERNEKTAILLRGCESNIYNRTSILEG